MKWLRAIEVSLVLFCATYCYAQTSHLAAGAAYFRHEHYSEALEEFKKAQIEHPKDASIDNLLGITETKLGELDKANEYYKKALELDPQLLNPHKNLAVNYLTAGRYDLAEAQLKQGLKLNARDPFLHYYLASLYLTASRDQDAIEQLEPAQSLIANDPALAYAMALACLRLHMDSKALELIADCEKQDWLNVAQEYQLAVMLTTDKMYSDAVDRFRRIVQAQPGSWTSRFDLAVALLNANQATQAVPVLEQLARERANDANILALLGSADELSGNAPKALEAYQAAVGVDPSNPDRYLDYTRLLMDLDRYGEAADAVQKGIQGSSDTYALDLRMGSIKLNQGRYGEARLSFQKAIDAQPEVALGYFALAQSFMREGHDQQAADVLAKGRNKVPADAMLEYLDGVVLSNLGKKAEAIAALKKSISLDANVAEPHYELGKLLLDAGLVKPAKEEFERVVTLAPEHANACYQLSRIYGRLGDKTRAEEMARRTQQLLQKQREGALEAQKGKLRAFQPVNQEKPQ